MGLEIQSSASRQEQITKQALFQLRKAKEKSSGALRKFRKSGTTVTPMIDHSLLDEVLAGK